MATMKYMRYLVSLIVTLCLLVYVAGQTSVDAVFNEIKSVSVIVILSCLVLFSIVLNQSVYRLGELFKIVGLDVSTRCLHRAAVKGFWASFFTGSLVGQVLGKHHEFSALGIPTGISSFILMSERLIPFLFSLAFFMIGFHWLYGFGVFTGSKTGSELLEVIVLLVVVLSSNAYFFLRQSHFSLPDTIFLRKISGSVLKIFLSTTVISISTFASFFVLGTTFSSDISFIDLLAAAAVISFAASLPFSINGWGIRELASVYVFGELGFDASTAISISVLVGLLSSVPIVLMSSIFLFKNVVKPISSDWRLFHVRESYLGYVTLALVISCAVFQHRIEVFEAVLTLNFADPLALLIAASFLIKCLNMRQLPNWKIAHLNWVMLALTISVLLSYFIGFRNVGFIEWSFYNRLIGWFVLLAYLSVGPFMLAITGESVFKPFVQALAVSLSMIVIYEALSQSAGLLGITHFDNEKDLNASGFALNRNAFAFQLLMASALLWSIQEGFSDTPKKILKYFLTENEKSFFLLLHGIIISGIFLTGSRAGMLAFFITVTVLLALRLIRFASVIRPILISIASFIVLTAIKVLSSFHSRFNSEAGMDRDAFGAIIPIFSTAASDHLRWETILAGLEMWLNSPFLGIGLGVFYETSMSLFGKLIVIHSTPFWILIEFGIVGFAVFAGCFGFLCFGIFKLENNKSQIAGIVGLLVSFTAFSLVHEVLYQRIFWLVLGICLAAPCVKLCNKKIHPKVPS